MIPEIVKLVLSEFAYLIIRNDAMRYEFIKNDGEPNVNGFLSKLLPNLVYYRKCRREEIRRILEEDFMRADAEKVYECVNTVIDQVYFSDAELEILEEKIWFRPPKKNRAVFDEIEDSEAKLAGQSTSVYIRNLLNEYARLPQYKRERLLFDEELYDFARACETGRIFHTSVDGQSIRMFAFHYVYEYTYHQENWLIGYDLTNKEIKSFPLYKARNAYVVEKKYVPSADLIDAMQKYYEDQKFGDVIPYEEEIC